MAALSRLAGSSARNRPASRRAIAPTFRDPRLQRDLEDHGFVVVPFLTTGEPRELRAMCDDVLDEPDLAFGTTALQPDRQRLVWLLDELAGRFRSRLDGLLVPHDVYCAQFYVKRHSFDGCEGDVELHQDLSFVDEARWRGMLMWCPLADIDPLGGRLQVVPGSHAISRLPRGTGHMAWSLSDAEAQLKRELVPLDVPRGHAVFYDSALVHASAPNTSGRDRPVVGLGLAPVGAEPIRFHADASDRVERLVVTPEYFMREQLRERPLRPVRSSLVEPPSQVSPAEVVAVLARTGRVSAASDLLPRPLGRFVSLLGRAAPSRPQRS